MIRCRKSERYLIEIELKAHSDTATELSLWQRIKEELAVRAYQPSRKLGSLLGGGAAYCGGAITGGPWYGPW